MVPGGSNSLHQAGINTDSHFPGIVSLANVAMLLIETDMRMSNEVYSYQYSRSTSEQSAETY